MGQDMAIWWSGRTAHSGKSVQLCGQGFVELYNCSLEAFSVIEVHSFASAHWNLVSLIVCRGACVLAPLGRM
eukprot:1156505-Pelagomonas_calceolata.AAC.3